MAKKVGDITFISEKEFLDPTGAMLVSREVFAVNGNTSALYVSNGSSLVTASGDPIQGIVGKQQVGEVMTVVLAPDWSATGYQWNRNGTPISGATAASRTLVSADAAPGVQLTVDVTGLTKRTRARTAAADVPGAPTNLVLTAGAGMVSAAFSAPADNGSAILSYTVVLSNGFTGTGPSSPIVISTPNNTAVNATITATNAIGTGPASAVSNTVTPQAAGDTTAPTAVSAAVANATPTIVAVTMSETMGAATPAASAFTVSGHTVTGVSISGSTISLTVSAAFVNGEAARTVSYTKPGSNPAADVAGNQLASFASLAVTNNVAAAGDTTAPTVASAAVANALPTAVVLTMSETMGAATPAASAFTVTGHTVSAVAVSGATITLTVDAFVNGEAARTVSYTKPGSNPAADVAGNQLASFSGQAITNNVQAAVTNVTSFPYTLQASDSGKTLNLQPAAEAKVVYPTSLGASFNCTLKQPSDNVFPITIEEATGVVGKNTNGLFISSSAGVQSKGLGSPMLRGPGAVVTVAATAADQFTLGGDVGKWQQIAHHTGYPAVWATALRQMSAASIHKLPGGKAGTVFTAIKFLYTNVYGVGETVAPADITITSALEYPMAAGTTPIQATFNGATSVTLTGGVKTVVTTDPIYPATPIPVDAFIRARTWQGGASGLVTNFGRDRQDYWTYGTTVGVDLDRTMQLYSTFPALSYTLHGTAFASPQSLRPLAIIGVTDTGAIILIGTSRDVSSNGDYPTPNGSGLQGEGERAWGRRGAVLNLAAATESMNGAWVSGNVANSAIRRTLFQYGGPVVNNYGVNDLNGGTAANIAALFTTTYNTSAEFLGRPMYVNTITASLIGTSDFFTTTAGQTPTNAANETKRMAINDLIRAGGLPRVTGYCEIADATETARNSGLLKVNARGRTITDGSISAGTNVFNSPAQAQFTSADDGCYISLPMGAAGAVVHAVMKYVSATSVNLVSYVQLAAYNAVTAVAAGQNVYLCSLEVMQVDGNHETQRGGNIIESLVVPPTLPAVGPVN